MEPTARWLWEPRPRQRPVQSDAFAVGCRASGPAVGQEVRAEHTEREGLRARDRGIPRANLSTRLTEVHLQALKKFFSPAFFLKKKMGVSRLRYLTQGPSKLPFARQDGGSPHGRF